MIHETYAERNRSYEEIRRKGALGNLNEGIEITLHEMPTRLIAWPGNGFQTESIHVLTLSPGTEGQKYSYDLSEEAYLCLKGKGEVFFRNQWLTLESGDIVYFPPGHIHSARNLNGSEDFILVSSTTPPSIDLYEAAGFYNKKQGVIDVQAVQEAKGRILPGKMSKICELRHTESYPELRAWNLKAAEIRQDGALFNYYKGSTFDNHGAPMRFVLWPGYGTRSAGFHSVHLSPKEIFYIHSHPTSDECIINFSGSGLAYVGDHWVEFSPNDYILAPCGVLHGGPYNNNLSEEQILAGGFASPPQLDLYMLTDYYEKGKFKSPPFTNLLK